MEEAADITPEELAKPKKKVILLAALILGVVLLGGGGWLVYQKMTAITAVPEQVHRKPTAAEIVASAEKKLAEMDKQAALRDPGSLPVAPLGEVSVDQLATVISESGERRITARLSNRAQKKLIFAQVDIRFLSASKQVLLTRAVNPLVVAGGLFGDQVEPLEAGTSRLFTVFADDAPASWAGDVDAVVIDFRFGSGVGEVVR